MKKKNLKRIAGLAIAMSMIMASLSGCGTEAKATYQELETSFSQTAESSVPSETKEEISSTEETTSAETTEVAVVEKTEDPNIELYESNFIFKEFPYECDGYSYEAINATVVADKDAISIYDGKGNMIGHINKGGTVVVTESANGWLRFENPVQGTDYDYLYIREIDVLRDGTSDLQRSVPKTESKTENKLQASPVVNEPVAEVPVQEQPVAEETEKYTPEEAIAVYRSIMEANGMTWDPSIKEFASWGTGFMYLDKGYPEKAAQMDLEGMAYGDGTGNSHNKYYFEITSSDENCVYSKAWACN